MTVLSSRAKLCAATKRAPAASRAHGGCPVKSRTRRTAEARCMPLHVKSVLVPGGDMRAGALQVDRDCQRCTGLAELLDERADCRATCWQMFNGAKKAVCPGSANDQQSPASERISSAVFLSMRPGRQVFSCGSHGPCRQAESTAAVPDRVFRGPAASRQLRQQTAERCTGLSGVVSMRAARPAASPVLCRCGPY